MPVDLEFKDIDGHRLGLASLEHGQALAVTTEFSQVDTGVAEVPPPAPAAPAPAEPESTPPEPAPPAPAAPRDIRCELICVARTGPPEVAAAVIAASRLLRKAGGVIPAKPGTLLPSLTSGTPLEQAPEITVRHGLLIAPYLWGGQCPQVSEEGRLTLVCQLLLLTDAEYAYALDESVAGLQQAVAQSGIDLLDWSRTGD